VEGSCEHGNETWGSIKCWDYFLSGCAIGSFSRRAQLHELVSVIPRIVILLHAFLTSSLDGGVWLASGYGEHTSVGSVPIMHRLGNCVAPRAGLTTMIEDYKLCSGQEPIPTLQSFSRNLDTLLTELG
jgi:hypothetical protein